MHNGLHIQPNTYLPTFWTKRQDTMLFVIIDSKK